MQRQGTTHIIGAGLAGLSAATRLVEEGNRVVVYEAASQAGGRCRSYYDAAFGATIDNGNHLLLSGNKAALAYLTRIGAGHVFDATRKPNFDFADAKTGERWTLRLNPGRFPLWLFDSNRRVPGTKIADYFSILRFLKATPQHTVAQLLDTHAPLYHRLWQPVLLAALNTQLEEASALLAVEVLRGTLFKGGNACIPIVAEGLSAAFIDPALQYLSTHNGAALLNRRVRGIHFENNVAVQMDFTEGEPVSLSSSDTVICATPPQVATSLLPGITVPEEYRAILNAHFSIAPPPGFPAIMGIVHATTEWIFAFPDRISVTVSGADRLMQEEREALAQRIWQEVAAITGLAKTLPSWQIVKEKRATFAATPAQNARRPAAITAWPNIYLAGDYVQTGLPATIEGAIASGAQAAELVMRKR